MMSSIARSVIKSRLLHQNRFREKNTRLWRALLNVKFAPKMLVWKPQLLLNLMRILENKP